MPPLRPQLGRAGRPADEAADALPQGAGDGGDSFAAVHPDFVAEWDREENTPLRPARIKATYDRTVQWRCLADPTHPPYRMSPRTRGKTEIGCPIHRPMARAATARQGNRAAGRLRVSASRNPSVARARGGTSAATAGVIGSASISRRA